MRFAVGIVTQFEAAHRLGDEFGLASRLHGHTYRLEVEVTGPTLAPSGALLDLGQLHGWVDEIVEELHYQRLDELPAFSGRNTTAEVVAQQIWEQLADHLRGQAVTDLSVTLWESPQAYARCSGTVARVG